MASEIRVWLDTEDGEPAWVVSLDGDTLSIHDDQASAEKLAVAIGRKRGLTVIRDGSHSRGPVVHHAMASTWSYGEDEPEKVLYQS
jgi:hypothetical protein